MNKNQRSKYTMYTVLKNYLEHEEYASILQEIPILETVIQDFKTIVQRITTIESTAQASVGATQAKLAQQEELKNLAYKASVAISVYAKRNQEVALFTDYTFNESNFYNSNYDEFIVKVQKITSKAQELGAILIPYGLKEAHLTQLQTSLQSFTESSTQTRSIINTNKTNNQELVNLFAQNRELIRNELDAIMNTLEVDYPLFVQGYYNARKVHKAPVRSSNSETPTPPQAPTNS